MNIKNGEVINLNSYKGCDVNKTLIITEDIDEITLTTNRKPCDFRVFVKARNSDLKINIDNLILNSEDDIGINFASGQENNYKSYLVFSGINTIESKSNIGVCITNNQTVEIKGKEDSFLKISGGSGVPSLGSSFYTEGAGNVIFSGEGSVEIIAGNSSSRENYEKTLGSGCGIGFYNENPDNVSSIKVLDNINLKVVGEDGLDTVSICEDKKAGKGGCGIEIKNSGIFEKKGYGLLEINGGNGGSLIGDYSSGICGNGGSAISFEKGEINIDNNATLEAGYGGSIKNEYEFPMVKGGHGGDIISLSSKNLKDISKIRIGNDIKVNLGNGGASGNFIDGENIKGFDGGNSGSLINSNNTEAKVEIGNLKIKEAIGGLGGNKTDKKNQGKNGEVQKKYLGESIEFMEFKEKKEDVEDLLKIIEEEKNIEDSGIDDSIEGFNDLDIKNEESTQISGETEKNENIIENLRENIINENLDSKRNSEIIEENIIDIDKSEDNTNILEHEEEIKINVKLFENRDIERDSENINVYYDLENNNKEDTTEDKEEDLKPKNKKSIWQAVKSFFILED